MKSRPLPGICKPSLRSRNLTFDLCHTCCFALQAVSEIDAMSAASTTLLDKHLGKTAEQVRKEQAASLAALIKKVEAAKGAPWAAQFKADLAGLSWYDNAVSANPAVGPRPSA